ncbi:hypothetical protein [Paenibacillus sp. FSL M7-0896]|uniref:portal protein n=1 Tax=Paenibacillus sp. FSL M7-0896 TaxID=2921610 RepID=UPI0030DA1C29
MERIQEDDNQKLRKRFLTDLDTSKKFMDPIHKQMDKNYDMYRNRWSDTSVPFRVSDLYDYVETVVPILTNSRTRSRVKSEFPDYVKHAEGMTFILDNTYDVNNWDYNAQRIARMAEIYRSAAAYAGYDDKANNGTGQLILKEINIRWCYLDPAVTELKDSSFFFYTEPMRRTKVISMYPDKKKDILKSIRDRKEDGSINSGDSRSKTWFKELFSSIRSFVVPDGPNKFTAPSAVFDGLAELDENEKRANSVAFIHYWYRDDDDKWRVSYWADDVMLEDLDNPFWHEDLPYRLYNPTEDILSSIGIPIAEQFEQLNWEKNVLMSEIIRNVRRQNDPPSVYNTTFGNIKDPRDLQNKSRDGAPIGVNNPDMVPLNAIYDLLTVPAVAAGAFNLRAELDAMLDKTTGTNDTMRGMGDATSGKEVALKQEAAYTRIKTKVDNFEKFVKELSQLTIINAMQYLNTAKAYRVKGDYRKYQIPEQPPMQQDQMMMPEGPEEPTSPYDVKPIQEGVDEQGQPVMNTKEFFLYANPNEWTQGTPDDDGDPETTTKDEVKKAYRIIQLTVEVEAGSSLPQSRMARREEAKDLYTMQAIDQQALLEAYDWPEAEEVIQRMQQAAKQAAAAQAAQQQAEQQAQAQQKQVEMEFKAQQDAQNQQHQQAMNQQNNQAKMQQIEGKEKANRPDIAAGLDKIREAVPELAGASDEQLLQLVAGLGSQAQ